MADQNGLCVTPQPNPAHCPARSRPAAPFATDRLRGYRELTQGPGECPYVADVELRLLHGGEVASAVEFGPVSQRGQDVLSPGADRPRRVLREDRRANRHRERPRPGPGAAEVCVEVLGFVVQLRA